MCNSLSDYNELNKKPLSNANIWLEIRKVMEEEPITDANNVTADTFSHAPNTQRENINTIFTSEKLDNLDKLVEAVKKLTINYAKYYESNTAAASDAQGNLTHNLETVNHTSNGKFEQKLLSYRTIPIFPPPENPGIDKGIADSRLVPQTLLMPVMKEIVADAASGGAWIHRTAPLPPTGLTHCVTN